MLPSTSSQIFKQTSVGDEPSIGNSKPLRQHLSLHFRSFSSANSLSSISTRSVSTKSIKLKNSNSLWASVSAKAHHVFTRSSSSHSLKALDSGLSHSPTLATIKETTAENHEQSTREEELNRGNPSNIVTFSPTTKVVLSVDYNAPKDQYHMPHATGVVLTTSSPDDTPRAIPAFRIIPPGEGHDSSSPNSSIGDSKRDITNPLQSFYGPSKVPILPLKALLPRPSVPKLKHTWIQSKPAGILRSIDIEEPSNGEELCTTVPRLSPKLSPIRVKFPHLDRSPNEPLAMLPRSPSATPVTSQVRRKMPMSLHSPKPKLQDVEENRSVLRTPQLALPSVSSSDAKPLPRLPRQQRTRVSMKPPSFISLNASNVGSEEATSSLKLPLGHAPSPRSRLSMKPPSFIPLNIPCEPTVSSLTSIVEKTPQPNSKSIGHATSSSKKENRPPPHNVQRRLESRPVKRSTSLKSKKPVIGTKAFRNATPPVRAEPRKPVAVRNAVSNTRVEEPAKMPARLDINKSNIGPSASRRVNGSAGGPTAKKKPQLRVANPTPGRKPVTRKNNDGATAKPNSTHVPAIKMVALDTAPQESRPVIASETLDLNNILKEKDPLFAERPLSGIFEPITNLSMRPLLVQSSKQIALQSMHDVVSYRNHDRSTSQSSTWSGASGSSLPSTCDSSDAQEASSLTDVFNSTAISPPLLPSFGEGPSSVVTDNSGHSPNDDKRPISSTSTGNTIPSTAPIKTPTAVRLHRLRLKCTGRMPTRTLSAALDWIEGENCLSLSPPTTTSMKSYFDPGSDSDNGNPIDAVHGRRQLLLSHGFLARGRRTSPVLSLGLSDEDGNEEGDIDLEAGIRDLDGDAAETSEINVCEAKPVEKGAVIREQESKKDTSRTQTRNSNDAPAALANDSLLNVRYSLFDL